MEKFQKAGGPGVELMGDTSTEYQRGGEEEEEDGDISRSH